MNRVLVLIGLALTLLEGCKTGLDHANYSPDYKALTRADGRIELVPVQCLEPSAEDHRGNDEDRQVRLLPPGCASSLALLQMVEKRSDLLQGRATVSTMAGPVGRAAQIYIDGYDREELRRRQSEQQARADKQERQ